MPTTGHRLNVQSPFARPRISTSNFGIFKDSIIIFMIALSIDNQLTVEWHIWLPYKTNKFYVQHDLLFSSKRPLCGNFLRISAFKFYLLSKSVLIDIKTKKCTPKSVLRWEFASVYLYDIYNSIQCTDCYHI